MTEAIATLIERTAPERVVLIGHSGGGTLAVLIGERLATVDAVVTVAANLDVDAWSRHHGYTPLAESLDPARAPAVRTVPQLHYSGAADDNVPPVLQTAFAQRAPHAEFRVIEGFGHTCCWAESWPTRLAEIDAFVTAATAPPTGG
jgi:pimeloyl-ACP methyl ester carboxylesterase